MIKHTMTLEDKTSPVDLSYLIPDVPVEVMLHQKVLRLCDNTDHALSFVMRHSGTNLRYALLRGGYSLRNLPS